jgi:hypothetical protein
VPAFIYALGMCRIKYTDDAICLLAVIAMTLLFLLYSFMGTISVFIFYWRCKKRYKKSILKYGKLSRAIGF